MEKFKVYHESYLGTDNYEIIEGGNFHDVAKAYAKEHDDYTCGNLSEGLVAFIAVENSEGEKKEFEISAEIKATYHAEEIE